MNMNLQIKLLRDFAAPYYKTEGAAGLDLVAAIDAPLTLNPMERALVPTGIAVAIPKEYGGFLFARSGLAARHGITLTNSVGVIDSDYRGEVQVSLINLGDAPYTITPLDRVCQLVLMPAPMVTPVITETLSATKRGEGGFGSTGK